MQEEKQRFAKRFSSLFSAFQQKESPVAEQAKPVEEAATQPQQPSAPPLFPPSMYGGPRWTLELPQEGAVWSLWGKWNAELEGGAPTQPRLTMDRLPPDRALLLDDAQMESELQRLRSGLESRAASRLKLIRDQQAKGAESARLPAECIIHLAQNSMMAWMLLFPPVGSGELPYADIAMGALRKSGITTGIDMGIIDNALRELRYFDLVAIAWGTPVVEGQDGRVVEHFPRQHVREPQVDEHGNVDYREANYVRTLHKGDIICDIIAPVEGSDGLQVTGKVVKAKVVQAAKPPAGRNTTVTPEGDHLVAALDGHLEYAGKVFQIKSILEIPGDVDYATGNINFFGDVHIVGDVRENFAVKATGSVTIDGLVEAATVEADGDIIITKGVLGDNKAIVRSKKTIRAKYLENCMVYAGDCVFADCIIASQVYSDNRISVLSGRGTIIGGCVSAAIVLEAAVLGSKAGRRTEVILGRMPNVEQERQNSALESKALQEQLDELERQIPYLESRPASAENDKLLSKLRLNRSVLSMKLEKFNRRLVELESMTPDLASCRMRCATVYPVTSVTIGSAARTIDNVWVNCMAYYDMENRDVVFT